MNLPEIFHHRGRIWMLLVCVFVPLLPRGAGAAESLTGEQIYRQKCASCHGQAGEGVAEHYAQPLAGYRSLAELTDFIAERMPEDDPGTCVGADAETVAGYIYDSFYSKAAQARNQRPRIELSRLTVRQYRHSVADLVGSFNDPGRWDDQRGLAGAYFKGNRPRKGNPVLERRAPTVNYQFGSASPEPGKIGAEEFSIRWQGGVLAPETGEYEFIVKSENGIRLWVNDDERPLIDRWVRSGSETEFRESIHLLGGRVYPLRLEFFKEKEKSASIALAWKPPHQVAEVIPERNLSPNQFPETLAVQTAFPPDDRTIGYERGASVSKEWDQATTYAAIEVAGYVVSHLQELADCKDDAPDRDERLREFCHRFAERAFRRPLSDEQGQFFIERHFEGAANLETAVKKVVLLVLKSPRFLYCPAGSGNIDAYDVASRISFGLWDSLPDQLLLEAAASGQLETRDQIARQAERMISDLRTKAKLREFLHQWLKIEHVSEVSKDRALFPDFDETTVSDLRTSLDLFLEDVVWSEASDFRQLLVADSLYLNGRLAKFYGGNLPADAPFQKVSLNARERAGVLSHPFLMAELAYRVESSPIHRGVFLSRSLLGRSLRPPPEAQTPLSPDLHPDLTTRERVNLQTSSESCQTCHAMINPLGFSLEQYDAVGRFRTEEQGRPIDAAGFYQTFAGKKVQFNGVRELAAFLAGSEETHTAFVEQLFHYLVKQPIRAYGPNQPEELRRSFAEHDFNIRNLLVNAIATSAVIK